MRKVILFAVVALAMTACSEGNGVTPDENLVPVAFTGKVTTIEPKAVVNSGEAFTAQVVATQTSGNFGTTYFDMAVSFAADGTGSYGTVKYYPNGGATLYAIGYAPADGANVARSGNTVTFTTDGSQDVMVSAQVSGSSSSPITSALVFDHLLTQLQFKVKANDTAAAAAWGDVTSIEVLAQDKVFDLDLATGALSVNSSSVAEALAVPSSAVTLGTTEVSAGYVLVKPVTDVAANALTLKIKTRRITEGHDVAIAFPGIANLEAGYAYEVNLTFKGALIELSGSVSPWQTGGSSDNIVD